ncbi:MAG: hypothetical protein ACOYNW_06210, partial [Undibacterium curvum]|uniref:hypothetical protein n=1 Tax=Undibacterium curvum TaxID=2762294 RepID=UPI003BE58A03
MRNYQIEIFLFDSNSNVRLSHESVRLPKQRRVVVYFLGLTQNCPGKAKQPLDLADVIPVILKMIDNTN